MARGSKSIFKCNFQVSPSILNLNFKSTLRKSWGATAPGTHRVRFIVNKKWEPRPSTMLQIYNQCVLPVFKYGSLSTITTSDTIIKIQRLQNKFIRLALRLPKYMSAKQLHDSSDLPYVKNRLLSRATRTSERISKNPLLEESITINRVNPAWHVFQHRSLYRSGRSLD